MSDIGAVFAKRLKERRLILGWSQADAATAIGRQQSHISMLESGALGPPRLEQARKIATAYHTSVDYLVGLTDDPAPAEGAEWPAYGLEVLNALEALPVERRAELLDMVGVMIEHEARRAAEDELARQLGSIILARLGPERFAELVGEVAAAAAAGDSARLDRVIARLLGEQKPDGEPSKSAKE